MPLQSKIQPRAQIDGMVANISQIAQIEAAEAGEKLELDVGDVPGPADAQAHLRDGVRVCAKRELCGKWIGGSRRRGAERRLRKIGTAEKIAEANILRSDVGHISVFIAGDRISRLRTREIKQFGLL